MADAPKKPEGLKLEPDEWVVVLILLSGFLSAGLPAIWHYITSGELTFYGLKIIDIAHFFKNSAWFFRILGYILAVVAIVAAFVYNKKTDQIWSEEKAKMYPVGKKAEPEISSLAEPAPNPLEERWRKIVEKSESDNSSEWRLSIIEADIILDELLQKLELPGETMGEKLKAVEKSDFTTLDMAWEAHKARNFIAHEGENFMLSQRETRRIISLYEAVFREFQLI